MNRLNRQKNRALRQSDSCNLVASCLILILLSITSCSANLSKPTSQPPHSLPSRPTRIVAQGQILPAEGLIRLVATPGDVVDHINVKEGDSVLRGQKLVTMRSLKIHRRRVEALQSRLEDARQQQSSAIEQSQQRLAGAELKLRQAEAQSEALDRQAGIVLLAQNQVTASEQILARLKLIFDDPVTKDFVGRIQLEQQQITFGDAQLKYRQEAENFERAKDAVSWSKESAELELSSAKTSLRETQRSQLLAALEAEMSALQLQEQSTVIVAPQDAIVVAVNTRVGETASQQPLIELANVSKTICEAEVVENDAALVEPNQIVKITSPALPCELHGKVLRRARLVGRPQLAVNDPLARADYRKVNVEIEIDVADVPLSAEWLQLQVSVEIALAANPNVTLGSEETP